MLKEMQVKPTKTYATHAGAVAAVEKIYGDYVTELRYFVACNAQGRYFPVFVGGEAAVQAGVHFHFNIVG